MAARILGLDVGGANLKAAHSAGIAKLVPFPLWKQPAELPNALRSLLATMPEFDTLAVTMTGELCDCFTTKREGVSDILDAVHAVAGSAAVRVWTTGGRFVSLAGARERPLEVAAANWLALATFAGRFAPDGAALLLDVGSTTTDVIPLLDGRPVPRGKTDPERLRTRELIYTGVRRTPLCALLDGPFAAEFFATTLDAFLVLGLIPEDPDDTNTADGRPAMRSFARPRLARMLCADEETSSELECRRLAERVRDRQIRMLREAIEGVGSRLPEAPRTVVLAGSGEFLGELALRGEPFRIVSLGRQLGAEISTAACAHALAVLADAPMVIKVGGSLYDLPHLGPRLKTWLERSGIRDAILVPGGGVSADVVRDMDRVHAIGDERAHWLAIQSLSLTARVLASLLGARVVAHPVGAHGITVLDPHAFALGDERWPGALPHTWDVTSDSIAARVAEVAGARRLVLMKSVDLPAGMGWEEAGERGLVDRYFAHAAPVGAEVDWVNLRREA